MPPSPDRNRNALRRLGLQLLALLGAVGLLFLILHAGAADIVTAFHRAGWWLLLLGPLHLVTVALDSRGWKGLLAALGKRISGVYLVWAAAVRYATQALVPIGIGGIVSGVRVLTIKRIPLTTSVASLVVEGSLMILSELSFVLIGILLYGLLFPSSARFLLVLLPILVADVAAGGLIIWAQIDGRIFDKLTAASKRVLDNERFKSLLSSPLIVKAEIQQIYAHRDVLVRCAAWQVASLFMEAVELWIIMRLMLLPTSIYFALLLQSLGRAARSLTFMVPAGIGVQEAVYALVAPLGGLSPGFGIALSLATRCRDIIFGVPLLLSWQAVEARLRKTGQETGCR